LVHKRALAPQEVHAPETKKNPPAQAVAYHVVEQVAEFAEHKIQTPLDNTYPDKQVAATLVAVQVAAPEGQTIHADATNEYPEIQVVYEVQDEQDATFLAQA